MQNKNDEEQAGENDKNEKWINSIFQILNEREYLYAADYPFEILGNNQIKLKDQAQLTDKNRLYIFLLLASSLNVFGLFESELTSEFELVCFHTLAKYLPSHATVKSFGKNSEYTGTATEKITKLAIDLKVNIDDDFLNKISPKGNQERGLDIIGWIPFLVAFLISILSIFGFYRAVSIKSQHREELKAQILYPSFSVLGLLFVFYVMGLLPPVPLAVEKMGIYHEIRKENGQYLASHEKPIWKFWQVGDQDFRAEPGDKVYFFASIFSPARFDDTVLLHWLVKQKQGWKTTDKISMRLVGGRKSGFRGFSVKEKYEDGDWQVRVETTDGREIGRLYFNITRTDQFNPARSFETEIH